MRFLAKTIPAALVLGLMTLGTNANILAATTEGGPKPRGLWFWGKVTSARGANNVVGDPEAEAEALDTFRRWNVRRLYGSYGRSPVERPTAIAAWHRRLHAAGIRSESLFSDSGAITPAGRHSLLQLVHERVVQFNEACADAAGRFDGVALDIEPHATSQWKTATPDERRAMLEEFLATCAALRDFLDAHGGRELTISAALACWLDRLPADGGRIGWKSATDRDEWFARLGRSVTSISLMAYERSRPDLIFDAVAWERAHFPGRTVTALRARLGEEWKSLLDLERVLPEVEAASATGVDLENYELLRLAEAAAKRR